MNVRSSGIGLFALPQNILKNIFIENYFNLIILKYQHSASRFAQQQNKEEAYIQNLTNFLLNKTKQNFNSQQSDTKDTFFMAIKHFGA